MVGDLIDSEFGGKLKSFCVTICNLIRMVPMFLSAIKNMHSNFQFPFKKFVFGARGALKGDLNESRNTNLCIKVVLLIIAIATSVNWSND